MLKSKLVATPPDPPRGRNTNADYDQLAQDVAACREGQSREIIVTDEPIEALRQRVSHALRRRGVPSSVQIYGKKLYITPHAPSQKY